MIKLMLVDDEPVIRKGMCTSIHWEKYGVEIVAGASNGMDALEKARIQRPHIVITDIRMPVMSGLELSDKLRKELPDTRIVLLSGYEEFEYAREAIGLGVSDYLLKPVGEKELVSVIARLSKEIAEEQEQKHTHTSLNIVFNENYPYIKSNFVKGILEGKYTDVPTIRQKADTLELPLGGPGYLVFIIDIDDFAVFTQDMPEQEKELLKYAVMNVSEELMLSRVEGFVCYGDLGRLVGLMNVEDLTAEFLDELCKEIHYCIKRHLGLSVSMGTGKVYTNLLDMKQSWSEAAAALRNKIFLGKGSVIHFKEDYVKDMTVPILYPSKEEKEIIAYIAALDRNSLIMTTEKIFSEFANNRSSLEGIRNICCRLAVISLNSLEEMGVNIPDTMGVRFNPYKEIDSFDTLEGIHNWLTSFFEKMILLANENRAQKFNTIIKSALKYIEENYDKDLNLSGVAGSVYVTPNYLSRIFKQEMGINFVDWLNGFRVEKAKELLIKTGIKSYEVAEKVGYKDYKYFSSVFRKFTGYSPKQYKANR